MAAKHGDIEAVQKQVDEVTGVMQMNITKVAERGGKLEELENRAQYLEDSSATFQKTSSNLHKKYLWKNRKRTIIVVVLVIILIGVIVIIALAGSGVFDSDNSSG